METQHPAYEQCFSIDTAQYRADLLTQELGVAHTVVTVAEGVYAAVPVQMEVAEGVAAVPVQNDAPPVPRPAHNPILDDDGDYFELNLLKHLDDSHIMKRLAIATAEAIQLPASTVFLTGLGVFSSIACRRYVVGYQHGGDVPIGLYVIAEQPSGTGKSWCLKTFQKPFFKEHKLRVDNHKKAVLKLKETPKEEQTDDDKQALKDLLANPPMPLFSTNPSPEALEQSLNFTRGFFSAISSEQGMINTLLGLSYGDSKRMNNNDLLLNGYDGGHINSQRIGRDGYCGHVIGALVSFAQNGSIEKMLEASNGTELAERCLFAAEPHFLGKRDKFRSTAINGEILADYHKIATQLAGIMYHHLDEDLAALTISQSGHRLITEYLICHKKGVTGEKVELEAVINYLSKKGTKTEREIINSLRDTVPFKNYSGNKSAAIKKTIRNALFQGVITELNGKFSIS